MGLPRTGRQNHSMWVIMDKLMKSAHFPPVKSTYSAKEYARIYINKIVSLHGILFTSYPIEVLNSLLILEVLSKRVGYSSEA